MSYLVDTDWVADWLRGRSDAVELLTALVSSGLAMSLVTYGEIYEGIYFGRDPQRSEQVFLDFLRSVAVLPIDQETMRRFARIRGELRRSGLLIGDADLLIGATAVENSLSLVTRNVRDFGRIPGLKLHPSH